MADDPDVDWDEDDEDEDDEDRDEDEDDGEEGEEPEWYVVQGAVASSGSSLDFHPTTSLDWRRITFLPPRRG